MPRLLKRLTLAFAVLVLGLLLAGWIALRVLATNVITDTTEPVSSWPTGQCTPTSSKRTSTPPAPGTPPARRAVTEALFSFQVARPFPNTSS